MVKKRWLSQKCETLLSSFPALVIFGARQCGKSTLAQMLRPGWLYIDLENPRELERIQDDPVLFFQDHNEGIILDEVQRFPQVFEILRGVIDKHRNQKNRFILTGSSHLDLMRGVSESLAGRIGTVELSGLSLGEKKDLAPSSFFEIFESPLERRSLESCLKLDQRHESQEFRTHLMKGGYPEPALSTDSRFTSLWMENYFEAYINRDMSLAYPGLDIISYQRVVRMLSTLSGTILNKSEISRSVEASEKTVRRFVDIIGGTYFWRELPSYRTAKIKTTLKLPKGHFRDSGLLLFLQNVTSQVSLDTYPRLGSVFESAIVEEVIRGVQSTFATNVRFEHFRTKAGGEIDLILSGSFGVLPIEVKHSTMTSKREIKALENFVLVHDLPLGLVFNRSSRPQRITERIVEIPVTCL